MKKTITFLMLVALTVGSFTSKAQITAQITINADSTSATCIVSGTITHYEIFSQRLDSAGVRIDSVAPKLLMPGNFVDTVVWNNLHPSTVYDYVQTFEWNGYTDTLITASFTTDSSVAVTLPAQAGPISYSDVTTDSVTLTMVTFCNGQPTDKFLLWRNIGGSWQTVPGSYVTVNGNPVIDSIRIAQVPDSAEYAFIVSSDFITWDTSNVVLVVKLPPGPIAPKIISATMAGNVLNLVLNTGTYGGGLFTESSMDSTFANSVYLNIVGFSPGQYNFQQTIDSLGLYGPGKVWVKSIFGNNTLGKDTVILFYVNLAPPPTPATVAIFGTPIVINTTLYIDGVDSMNGNSLAYMWGENFSDTVSQSTAGQINPSFLTLNASGIQNFQVTTLAYNSNYCFHFAISSNGSQEYSEYFCYPTPNPANVNEIAIASPTLAGRIAYVFNLNGQAVYNQKLTKNSDKVKIGSLTPGIYVLKIEGISKAYKFFKQ